MTPTEQLLRDALEAILNSVPFHQSHEAVKQQALAAIAAPLPAQPQGQAVAWLNDMGTEQKLSFAPLPGAFEHFALGHLAAPPSQAPESAQSQGHQSNRARLINRLQACVDDPVWPDHARVSKKLLEACLSALVNPLDGDL